MSNGAITSADYDQFFDIARNASVIEADGSMRKCDSCGDNATIGEKMFQLRIPLLSPKGSEIGYLVCKRCVQKAAKRMGLMR